MWSAGSVYHVRSPEVCIIMLGRQQYAQTFGSNVHSNRANLAR